MLRRMGIGLAVACSLALAGCANPPATGGGGGPIITIPGVDDSTAAAIQSKIQQVCGYQVTWDVALSLVGTLTGSAPITSLISSLAAGVCSKVTAKSFRRGRSKGPPVYNGVRLNGQFVR